MASSTSAHVDTFAGDNLPPRDQWPELRFDLPELHYPERLNAAVELLDKAIAEGHGARKAVIAADHEWTYDELNAWSNRIAHVLVEDQGLVPGNRVLLRAPNNAMLLACWFAVLKAGGVVVATMPLLRTKELLQIIEKAEISHAISDHRLLDELAAAQAEAPVLKHLTSYGAGGALDEAAAAKPADFQPVDTASEDVALLAFTSGTTGNPKACMHFHRDVLAMGDTFCRHIVQPQAGDVFCGTPPIAFTFGLGGSVVFPFYFRATTALFEKASPETLIEAIQQYKVTTLFTAPTAYRAMLGMLKDFDISSLHSCVSAGEALPRATSDSWFEATGKRIIDGIGSTEMIHIFISARGEDIRPGATGKPVPGYVATLLDENDDPFDGPGEGRLAIKGPTGCRYLADDRQKNYVIKGWNVTGDTYRRDEDGYYWYQARADDMIVSSGYNIAGPEVEQAVLMHPCARECAVVGAPDAERGMLVKAYIVLNDGFTADGTLVKEVQDFVKKTIAPYKYPRAVEFVETLPKTQTGKLQRYVLRQQAAKQDAA